MMTYKVWRVEDIVSGMHRGRLATYTSCYGDIGLSSFWHGEQLRPVPWVDGIPKCLHRRKGWAYGCDSKALLHAWFSPYDLFLLGMAGAVVRCYEVSGERNILSGGHQSIFFKSAARLIDEVPALSVTFVKDLEECGMEPEEIQDLIDAEHLAEYQLKTGVPVWDEEFHMDLQ